MTRRRIRLEALFVVLLATSWFGKSLTPNARLPSSVTNHTPKPPTRERPSEQPREPEALEHVALGDGTLDLGIALGPRRTLGGIRQKRVRDRWIRARETFASPVCAIARVEHRWLFATLDGLVAESDDFLGAPRRVASIAGGLRCTHTATRGVLLVVDRAGQRWRSDDGRTLVRAAASDRAPSIAITEHEEDSELRFVGVPSDTSDEDHRAMARALPFNDMGRAIVHRWGPHWIAEMATSTHASEWVRLRRARSGFVADPVFGSDVGSYSRSVFAEDGASVATRGQCQRDAVREEVDASKLCFRRWSLDGSVRERELRVAVGTDVLSVLGERILARSSDGSTILDIRATRTPVINTVSIGTPGRSTIRSARLEQDRALIVASTEDGRFRVRSLDATVDVVLPPGATSADALRDGTLVAAGGDASQLWKRRDHRWARLIAPIDGNPATVPIERVRCEVDRCQLGAFSVVFRDTTNDSMPERRLASDAQLTVAPLEIVTPTPWRVLCPDRGRTEQFVYESYHGGLPNPRFTGIASDRTALGGVEGLAGRLVVRAEHEDDFRGQWWWLSRNGHGRRIRNPRFVRQAVVFEDGFTTLSESSELLVRDERARVQSALRVEEQEAPGDSVFPAISRIDGCWGIAAYDAYDPRAFVHHCAATGATTRVPFDLDRVPAGCSSERGARRDRLFLSLGFRVTTGGAEVDGHQTAELEVDRLRGSVCVRSVRATGAWDFAGVHGTSIGPPSISASVVLEASGRGALVGHDTARPHAEFVCSIERDPRSYR
ncbi:MAG: hypothetical protein JNK05_25350 [Myxococcales bacterium]|nr:hypothetical protein [Myxococcales bacterium]